MGAVRVIKVLKVNIVIRGIRYLASSQVQSSYSQFYNYTTASSAHLFAVLQLNYRKFSPFIRSSTTKLPQVQPIYSQFYNYTTATSVQLCAVLQLNYRKFSPFIRSSTTIRVLSKLGKTMKVWVKYF